MSDESAVLNRVIALPCEDCGAYPRYLMLCDQGDRQTWLCDKCFRARKQKSKKRPVCKEVRRSS
jgi:hypothetical protein